jgi:hypothetical protein
LGLEVGDDRWYPPVNKVGGGGVSVVHSSECCRPSGPEGGGGSDLVGKRGTWASSRSCGDEGGRVEQVGWAKMARNWIWNLTKALGFDLGRI